jgi:predicted AlkP superfamily pyrophosphatase or phosphodiesterase
MKRESEPFFPLFAISHFVESLTEKRLRLCLLARRLIMACGAVVLLQANMAWSTPKVVLISLDGATPRLLDRFLEDGTLSEKKGLGLLIKRGSYAEQNVTVSPSLTAPGHIAIATGSTAAKNDVVGNTFHLVASPFTSNISGFGAPIGGYNYANHMPEESEEPTAEPLWVKLRAAGKTVVTATFPGGDGVDVRVPGLSIANSPIIQSSALRTVDYTVPFGAFAGAGAIGFELTAANFGPAPQATTDQLVAAGKAFYGPVLQKSTPLETLTIGGVPFILQVAALDSTNDNRVNYDTLVIFDQNGIKPGPFSLPSTGSAYAKLYARSAAFYFEGSANKAGAGFFVSTLAPDLSIIHLTRYSANFIPRNAAVINDVDDINTQVGFWAPQADFRIPERLSPGFNNFSDQELEAIYADQVKTFVAYQTQVALRAISQKPDADLAMIYIEQPDGSSHQFLIDDPRQATNPLDATTIGVNQDKAKIARYRRYLATAYQAADQAVQSVIAAVGTERNGNPKSDIFVVSDHGFAPFHTAVNMNAFLANQGFDPNKVRAITSGPAVNLYINLQGREPNGTVSPADYVTLQQQLIAALKSFKDTNVNYSRRGSTPVFGKVYSRPVTLNSSGFGLETGAFIGQDSGDVYALLSIGYNFDGTQNPVVQRLGESSLNPVFSVPNFYGAHGYDPEQRSMSAIFIAAGPDIRRSRLDKVRNIDVAPTILDLLGVQPAATVDGQVLPVIKK